MSSEMEQEPGHELGEFVSFHLAEDHQNRTFTLTLTGNIRFSALLAQKIGQMRVSDDELREWVEG